MNLAGASNQLPTRFEAIRSPLNVPCGTLTTFALSGSAGFSALSPLSTRLAVGERGNSHAMEGLPCFYGMPL